MARMKSITSIDAGISKVEKEIQQTKARYDKLTGELEKLQNEKRDYEAKTIMDAFIRSGCILSIGNPQKGVRTFSWTINQSISVMNQAAISPRYLRY